jgi:hypothetical protein
LVENKTGDKKKEIRKEKKPVWRWTSGIWQYMGTEQRFCKLAKRAGKTDGKTEMS